MKRKLMLLTALLLAAVLVVGACSGNNGGDENGGEDTPAATEAPTQQGGDEQTTGPVTEERPLLPQLFGWQSQFDNHGLPRDPMTVTMNSTELRHSGPIGNIGCFMIRDATGITVDFRESTAETFNAFVAVGDLPDIITFTDDNQRTIADLIMTGQLVNLEPYLARTQYLYQTLEGFTLNWIRHWTYENTGIEGIFWLPHEITKVGDANIVTGGDGVGYIIPMDLYHAIGTPPIYDANGFNEDLFLDMLYQMQQYARNELGHTHAYALGGFTEWGQWWVIEAAYHGGITGQGAGNRYHCAITGEFFPAFHNPDHFRWDALRFTNRAYRMGLFDPESFILDWGTYISRTENREILTTPMTFIMLHHGPATNGHDINPVGYFVPRGTPFHSGILMIDNPVGFGFQEARAINANLSSAEIERIVALLDYAMSDEFVRDADRVHGLYGVHWEYGEDGYPEFIGDRLQQFLGNEDYVARFGIGMEFDFGMARQLRGITERIHADGFPQRFMYADFWQEQHATIDEDFDFFRSIYNSNAPTLGHLYMEWVEEGIMRTTPTFNGQFHFTPAQPSEYADIAHRVELYIQENEARLAMAPTEEAFESILAEVLAHILAMGEDRVHADALVRLQQSQQTYREMMGR